MCEEKDCLTVPKEVIFNNTGWLSNSLVGILRWNRGVIPSLPGIYKLGGIKDVKLSRLGSNKVLVSFPNLEKVSSALGEEGSVWKKAFVSLEKWVLTLSASVREVWVQCYGVPLLGWSEEVFRAIGNNIGEVVHIAKETLEKSVLEYGRLSAKTDFFGFINLEVRIQIFGFIFKVLLREEIGLQSRGFKDKGGGSMAPSMEQHMVEMNNNKIVSVERVESTSSGDHEELGGRKEPWCRIDELVPETQSAALAPAIVDDVVNGDRSSHLQSSSCTVMKRSFVSLKC